MKFLARVLFLVPLSCLACSDAPNDSRSVDYESLVPETTEPRNWKCTTFDLGDSGYVAYVGPTIIKDRSSKVKDYYSMSVEFRRGLVSSTFFSRKLPMRLVPKDVRNLDAKQIVSFNPESRTVRFDLRAQQFSYVLPEQPDLPSAREQRYMEKEAHRLIEEVKQRELQEK